MHWRCCLIFHSPGHVYYDVRSTEGSHALHVGGFLTESTFLTLSSWFGWAETLWVSHHNIYCCDYSGGTISGIIWLPDSSRRLPDSSRLIYTVVLAVYDRIHRHLTYVPPNLIRRVLCKLVDIWKLFLPTWTFLNNNHQGDTTKVLEVSSHFLGGNQFFGLAIWGDGFSTWIGTFFSIHIQISAEYLGFFCQSSASWLQLLGNWSRRCCRLCVGTTCGLYYYSNSVQHCEKFFMFLNLFRKGERSVKWQPVSMVWFASYEVQLCSSCIFPMVALVWEDQRSLI